MRSPPVGAAVAAVPVVFDFVGYHFQAGPLIVGIAGVVLSRQIITLQGRAKPRWGFEIVVMLFCAFVTALLVQDVRSLLYAGVTGLGVGGLGVGLLGIINSVVSVRIKAALSVLFNTAPVASGDEPPARPMPAPDDQTAIDAAIERLNRND